jgi:hypothetical protein
MFDSILAILIQRTRAQWCFSTMVETNSDPGAWEHGPGIRTSRRLMVLCISKVKVRMLASP